MTIKEEICLARQEIVRHKSYLARLTKTLDDLVSKDIKQRVNKAFRILRKDGVIARQNFMCCSSCATAALEPIWKKTGKTKIVYYHKQDGESFNKGYNLTIRYGHSSDDKDKTRDLGIHVTNILVFVGLVYDWDGDPEKTIQVGVALGVNDGE